MERLTEKRVNGIKSGYWSAAKKDELVQRLGKYEDTGLEPEEIVKLNSFTDNQAAKLLEKYQHEVEKHRWIPVDERLPETDDYILLSFSNFSLPMVGRYEADYEGGAFYLGDCDEDDTCINQDLFVNAWMPLPEPYRPD